MNWIKLFKDSIDSLVAVSLFIGGALLFVVVCAVVFILGVSLIAILIGLFQWNIFVGVLAVLILIVIAIIIFQYKSYPGEYRDYSQPSYYSKLVQKLKGKIK